MITEQVTVDSFADLKLFCCVFNELNGKHLLCSFLFNLIGHPLLHLDELGQINVLFLHFVLLLSLGWGVRVDKEVVDIDKLSAHQDW